MSPRRRPPLLEILQSLDPALSPAQTLREARLEPALKEWIQEERRRLAGMCRHEGLGPTEGDEIVAGADEVGRGPLAGPLVAAAVSFRRQPWIPGLKDSKKLHPREREAMVPWILAQAVAWEVEVVSVEALNSPRGTILSHSLDAMRRCVERMRPLPHRILVDGNACLEDFGVSQEAVVKGDDRCVTVAAASVLAKVERDRLMADLEESFPGYGFARHKGYGTAEHLEALEALGPCAAHRTRFSPVRDLLAGTPRQGILDFG